MDKRNEIAKAIVDTFSSPNVMDSNFETANIVDVIERLAASIKFAAKHIGNGDASTYMGALEAHGKAMRDAADIISGSIDNLANAIRDHGNPQ